MIPDFHDGYLDGLFVYEARAKLFLRTYQGQKFTLVLRGVERLRAEDFLQGNIVFDLEFRAPEQWTREFIDQLYGFTAQSKQSFVMENWIQGAKQKGLQALEISSSYGCSVSAVFKDYELLEGYVFDQ